MTFDRPISPQLSLHKADLFVIPILLFETTLKTP
jgi:hypothetical protein